MITEPSSGRVVENPVSNDKRKSGLLDPRLIDNTVDPEQAKT
jgi:hypothetical protein